LLEIRDGYVNTLNELGKNNQTVSLSIEYAEFEAYYMNNLEKAIEILLELIERKDVDERLQARAKLNLGDYYLMYGEFWESSLLYSQVDKSFQEGILGELARYKNARLSYFNGDFEWSKMQLDVLKPSTSKLISNDAIDLSVFISENTGLDTTTIPLEMFAAAELLALQHKYEASFERLDSINILYPDHELEDDIWYLKANIYTDLKDYDNAVKYYNDIILKHADDIRGDNAIFELAQLYETTLNNQEEAISLYEKLFLDYSSSTFSIEARKKYRTLTKKEGENKEADPEELSPEENFMRGIKN
jgi:tetratricopeptide (TPR) repeat protein